MNQRLLSLLSGLVVGAVVVGFFLTSLETRGEAYLVSVCATESRPPTIRAHAGYVEDVVSGTPLFMKNHEAQLPLASLAKVMTILVARESLPSGSTVTITHEALTPEGGGLSVGEEWQVEDLADYTLIASNNDGARALLLSAIPSGGTESDFIAAMNRRAVQLGLSSTFFINETGLDLSSTTAGAYGSARDVARLLGHVAKIHPSLVERSVNASVTFYPQEGERREAKNTSLLATALAAPIASKTGFTDLAGGNLALVFEPVPGRPVAIVVLGSTRDERFSDAESLAAYAAARLRLLLACGDFYD